MRLLVTGSRKWADRDLLFRTLDELHQRLEITVLIEGCAAGADQLAEEWALERDVLTWHYPAEWRPNGVLDRSAGVRRNSRMLADSEPEMAVAFWDGQSHGTADMIRKARTWGLREVLVVSLAEVPA